MRPHFVVQVKSSDEWKSIDRFEAREDSDKAQTAADKAVRIGKFEEVRILESVWSTKKKKDVYKLRYSSGRLEATRSPPSSAPSPAPRSGQQPDAHPPASSPEWIREHFSHDSQLDELTSIYVKNLARIIHAGPLFCWRV